MTLRRGFLFGLAAVTLFAQDLPLMDKAWIERSVAEAKRVQLDQITQVTQEMVAKQNFAMDKMEFDKARFAIQGAFFQRSGGPLSQDEELKVIAIDSLMESDSERAIPLVDKILQNQQASVRLRMRALQALGRNNSTKARDIVLRVAKDGSNADLQSRAIQILGSRESGQNRQRLSEIYASASSPDAKRQILRSWAGMGARDQIINVAKSDPNPEIRAAAVNQLGGMRANAELGALYTSESSTDVRERILRTLGETGDWQRLLEIAKTEKNEDLRNRAIQSAGSTRMPGVADALTAMYISSTEASMRSAILRALSNQGNAKQLIAVAQKETDPELKRSALQHLSRMKGEEVTTYLMELLNK
jgi:hypothetical protein